MTSLSLSRPAASSTRKANTSVAEPGDPVEMRLPFRSSILFTPVPSTVTTCMWFGYITTRAWIGSLPLVNLSVPLIASHDASTWTKARSALPVPMSFRLSTEPPVTSAVAVIPGNAFDRMLAKPPPSG